MRAVPFPFRREAVPTHRQARSGRPHLRAPSQGDRGCPPGLERMRPGQTQTSIQIEVCVSWRLLYIIAPMKSIILTCTVLLVPVALLAHHAYSAEFDTTKPIKLSGVLTKVEWSNPHIWIYLDVKDEKGNVTNWGFSASPPGMLQRRGITKNSLKLGDVLTITGHRAKDGSNNASG